MGFCHLHCHSEYSSLDGGSRVSNMPQKLADLGMTSMALTDHGVMQGLPDFQHHLREAGIQPILGLEAYLTDDRFDHSRGTTTWHLTLLAENDQGYKNLCQISSYAFREGTIKTFGRPRPRADWKLLEEYSEGIICLTGCMAGPVMQAIMKEGSISKARHYTERLLEIFGKENVYGELQNVGITVGVPGDSEVAQLLGKNPLSEEEAAGMEGYHGDVVEEVEAGEVPISQTEANRILVEEICKPLGIAYVATGDVHYLEEKDADPHDAMLCIGTGQVKKGQRRFSLLPKRYHMRSEEEMREAIPEYPESLEETVRVAARCSAEIEFGKELLPRFPLPDGFKNSGEYLRHLCEEGARERYGEDWKNKEEIIERLNFELGVIDKMGYNDYFLIVWDLFREARDRNIPAGPGRGSAAGAIVAYTLGITQLCPLEYGLLFERFLNPDRISMPDIDMDFGPSRRGELMEYARDKYNDLAGVPTAVAQQVTFSRYKAKGALRDSARVLADPSEDGRREALRVGDRLASLIPDDPSATMRSVWEDKREGAALKKAYGAGALQKEIIKQAGWLEGLVRAYSIHAAAVLIADHDLAEDLPLQQFGEDQPLHIQYEMNWAEALGLLKMDFLGLRNLEVIQDAIEKIRYTHGVELDPYQIPIDDEKTYQLFARGETIGTFQFESEGMRAALKQVAPTELRDLVAIVALYRPGPMAHIPHYAARKAGREKVEYLHPKLEAIQGETYGITVYQEQSMLVARELAGFTPGQADDLRKAIGKKLHDKMATLKPLFLKGCADNGVSKEVAEELWRDNEAAADYSFNKSHAACYAYVSYVTGYLKANYPEEYMAALLSSVMGDKDKGPMYLTEASLNMKIRILPPDVNRSLRDFSVQEGDEGEQEILVGLTAIKKVGGAVVSEILQERKDSGSFSSLRDFMERLPGVSKGAVEALVLAGALDSTGSPRKAMYEAIEDTRKELRDEQKARERTWKNGLKEIAGKSKKLDALDRKGLEAAALLSLERDDAPTKEDLRSDIAAALEKETLRAARASIRKEIKDGGGDPTSEENKERIEEEAARQLEKESSELAKKESEILELARKTIEEFIASKSEEDGLEAALQEELRAPLQGEEWSKEEKLRYERELLGDYISGSPLDPYINKWANSSDVGLGMIGAQHIDEKKHVVATLVGKTERRTKTGKKMYQLRFRDPTGSRDAIAWQEVIEGYEPILQLDSNLAMDVLIEEDHFQQARQEESEESSGEKATRMTLLKIYPWNPDKIPETWNLTVPEESWNKDFYDALQDLALDNPGEHRIKFSIVSGEEKRGQTSNIRMNRTSATEKEVERLVLENRQKVFRIKERDLSPDFLEKLKEIASAHPGQESLVVLVHGAGGEKRKRTPYSVSSSKDLDQALDNLLS